MTVDGFFSSKPGIFAAGDVRSCLIFLKSYFFLLTCMPCLKLSA